MPDVSKPLGQTVIDGLAGLIYDDPVTLWGSALAVAITAGLKALGVVSGIWIGVVLFIGVWVAIGLSLMRAVAKHTSSG
jgi:hypothetical protein